MKIVAKGEEQRDEETMKERTKEIDRRRRHSSFLKLMCEIRTDRLVGLVLLWLT